MDVSYERVLEFATRKHAGQFRADGVTPYIQHPIKVAEIVKKYKKSKNIEYIVAAALLHDTLEDTYTSYKELKDEFGEVVASMVMEVTNASFVPMLYGKGSYLKHKMINMSHYALVIKLADRLANLLDCRTLPKQKQNKLISDTKEIVEYLQTKRQLTPAQQSIIDEINKEVAKYDFLNNLN